MITKLQKIAIGATAVSATIAPMLASASGFASPEDASAVISTAVASIGSVLTTSIPTVLAVATALLGVLILWRFARRTIK